MSQERAVLVRAAATAKGKVRRLRAKLKAIRSAELPEPVIERVSGFEVDASVVTKAEAMEHIAWCRTGEKSRDPQRWLDQCSRIRRSRQWRIEEVRGELRDADEVWREAARALVRFDRQVLQRSRC